MSYLASNINNNLKEKIAILKKEQDKGVLLDDSQSYGESCTAWATDDDLCYGTLCDSDIDSIDDAYDDPFRHCDVFQADETAIILRDKMIKLQSLYIGQLKHLQHLYTKKRKQYLKAKSVKSENIIGSSRQYKALAKYHKRNGLEVVMQQRNLVKRNKTVSSTTPSSSNDICSYTTDVSNKCGELALPATKFCRIHILCDSEQKLYKACNYGGHCNQPILAFENLCNVHKLDWCI